MGSIISTTQSLLYYYYNNCGVTQRYYYYTNCGVTQRYCSNYILPIDNLRDASTIKYDTEEYTTLKRKTLLKKISKECRNYKNVTFVNTLYHGKALQTNNVNLAGAQKSWLRAPSYHEQEQFLRFHGYVVPGKVISATILYVNDHRVFGNN